MRVPGVDPSPWHIRPQCFCHLSLSRPPLPILVFRGGTEPSREAKRGKVSLKTHHWPLILALAWVCFSSGLKYSPCKTWLWLCYLRKKKMCGRKLQGMCVPVCVCVCVCALAFPLKTLHDKSPFPPLHSSLSAIQQVVGMKYLAEDKLFHVLLWTQLLPGPFA